KWCVLTPQDHHPHLNIALLPDEQSQGGIVPSTLYRPKRERKQRSYTLCEVCNIQLNSAAQAQIHYNGKSHQKRLKQISNGKMPNSTGTSAQGSPLLASLPVPGRPLQPQLDLKQLLPFRLNGSSPLSLFPNFNTMDPVQKAVINHTFGVPQPLKKKQIISCNICHLRFNSTNQAEAHYKGHKHARKLKAMEAQKNRQRRAGEASSAGRERDRDRERERDRDRSKSSISPSSQLSETASDTSAPEAPEAAEAAGLNTDSGSHADVCSTNEEPHTDDDKEPKKSKAHLHCPVCKVTVNSLSQLEAHNSGTKHKLMLEGHSVLPRRRGKVVAARAGCKSKRLGSKGSVGVPSKNFQCEVCEIFVNSETHHDFGKHVCPTKHAVPSLCSSLASHHSPSYLLQTKLALQKQLTKSLTTGFLPSPLTPPTLCTVATNPLALRHPVGTTTFIQTPFLGPALFRPAPGPLRATHTPIIFSPY
uniref:Zinc finger protein 385C n=1 Tax=Echeneis naucrates TaxID=173247 RepID=A0A665T4S4_ECHNA